MGGSESYTSLEYYSGRSDKYNSIHHAKEKENELSFDYSGQNLFYGMRYEVTIPTYAIVGMAGSQWIKTSRSISRPLSLKRPLTLVKEQMFIPGISQISPKIVGVNLKNPQQPTILFGVKELSTTDLHMEVLAQTKVTSVVLTKTKKYDLVMET